MSPSSGMRHGVNSTDTLPPRQETGRRLSVLGGEDEDGLGQGVLGTTYDGYLEGFLGPGTRQETEESFSLPQDLLPLQPSLLLRHHLDAQTVRTAGLLETPAHIVAAGAGSGSLCS